MGLHKDKLNSVQGLRALAVVLVVYAHSTDAALNLFGKSLQTDFFYLENWGAIGLDLFFVISGFIMTRVAPSYFGPGRWQDFLSKRAIRIFPLYWGLTVFSILTMLIGHQHISSLKVLKAVLFVPLFDGAKFVLPILHVGWSLSFEIYFYFLIGVLLFFNKRNFTGRLIFILGSLALIGSIQSFDNAMYKYITSPLLIEFMLGVLCGVVYDRLQQNTKLSKQIGYLSIIIGMTAAMGSIFWGYGQTSEVGPVLNNSNLALYRSINWGIPCAIFLLGCILLERNRLISTPRLVIRVGDASYSNYLLHGFLIRYILKGSIIISGIGADCTIILLTLSCTLASIPFYSLVEKPLTNFATNLFAKKNLAVVEAPIIKYRIISKKSLKINK